jgi:hypothetical protein
MEKQHETSHLVDVVCDQVVEAVRSGRKQIGSCAIYQISCEGWLKVEILIRLFSTFLQRDAGVEIIPEYGKRRIDLAVLSPEEQILLELKTFPTNYGQGGKPITNFVNGVIDDLKKVSEEKEQGSTGLAAWLAYPIPNPTPETWPNHLAKIEAHANRTLRTEQLDIFTPNEYANLYVMESK